MSPKMELHGKPRNTAALEDYKSPDEYADQGDTRVVRDLQFSYLVALKDAAGNDVLTPVDLRRNEEIKVEDMGLIALEKGERLHSFYTTDELEARESGRNPDTPATGANVSEMGEYELADYIKGENPEGKKLTVDETLALVPDGDKDFAHRLLQAENIATDGDPRNGVEVGLTAIIERQD